MCSSDLTLPARVRCGFIHLPSLPAEVAGHIARAPRATREGGLQQLASMHLVTQRKAVEIALATTLATPTKGRPPRA